MSTHTPLPAQALMGPRTFLLLLALGVPGALSAQTLVSPLLTETTVRRVELGSSPADAGEKETAEDPTPVTTADGLLRLHLAPQGPDVYPRAPHGRVAGAPVAFAEALTSPAAGIASAPARRGARAGARRPVRIDVPDISTLPPEDAIARAVWTANGIDRVFSGDRFARALVIGVANRVAAEGLSGPEARRVGDALKAAERLVAQCPALAEAGAPNPAAVSRCALTMADALPASYRHHVAAETGEFFSAMHRRGADAQRRGQDAVARAQAFESYVTGELDRTWTAAEQIRHAGTLFERGIGDALAATPGMATREVLRRNRELASLVAQTPAINAALGQGRLPNRDALVQDFSGFLQSRSGVDGRLVSAGVRLFDEMGSSGSIRSAMRQSLGDERAMVSLASSLALTLGGQDGARISNAISTVGSAAVTIRSLYASAPTLLAAGQTAAQLATFTSALGAASSVAALLGGGGLGGLGGGGGVSQADIQALGAQIRAMHMEMTASFRRVDAKLDSLMAVTVEGFDRMEQAFASSEATRAAQFALVHQRIEGVERQLVTVQATLEEIQEQIEGQPARDALRECRDYRVHTPSIPIERGKWETCLRALADGAMRPVTPVTATEDMLFGHMVLVAMDSAAGGRSREAYPLLATIAARMGRTLLRDQTVSLPRWAKLSAAYAEILVDWPDHAKDRTSVESRDLERRGELLRGALQSLTTNAGAADTTFLGALLTQYERRAEAFQEVLTQVVLTQSRRHRHRADLWLGERPAAAAERDRAHYAARPPMLEVRSNHAAWGNFSRPLPDTIRRRLPAAVQTALEYGEAVQFRAEVTAAQRDTFPTVWINLYGRREIGVCDNVSANGRRCKEHRRMIHHGATMVLTVSAPGIPMLERYTFHIPEEHIRTEAHVGWPRSPGGLQRVISGLQQHEIVDAWLPRLIGQMPQPQRDTVALQRFAATTDSLRGAHRDELVEDLRRLGESFRLATPPVGNVGDIPQPEAADAWRVARELRASKRLLEGFLELALPQSLAENRHDLRALTYGAHRALDDLAMAADSSGLLGLWQREELTSRAGTWRVAALTAVRSSGGTETHPLISETQGTLQVARRIHESLRGASLATSPGANVAFAMLSDRPDSERLALSAFAPSPPPPDGAVEIWMRAYIPGPAHAAAASAAIQARPNGQPGSMVKARLPLVSGVTQLVDQCFLTDHRGPSTGAGSAARMETRFTLTLMGGSATVAPARNPSVLNPTTEVSCASGAVLRQASGAVPLDALGAPAVASGTVQVIGQVRGTNTLAHLGRFSPSIDYAYDLQWTPATSTLQATLTYGEFPAFEVYARRPGGAWVTVLSHTPTSGPWALTGNMVGVKTARTTATRTITP